MSDPLLDKLLASIDARQPVALVTVTRATGAFVTSTGRHRLVWLDKASDGDLALGEHEDMVLADAQDCLREHGSRMLSYRLPEGNIELFVEVQHQPPTLIIVGAGHVALPLAKLGKMIDFDVVVLDDRPKFANKQRFPTADHVLAQPFTETLRNWPITDDTYIVLVTRGHAHDVECLLEVLDTPARYIGMIGSKRRVHAVFELLEREKGIEPVKFERVYSPIGLDIGAETPAEIAIAIMAEIINFHRGGRAVPLSDALRADRRLPLHPRRTAKGYP